MFQPERRLFAVCGDRINVDEPLGAWQARRFGVERYQRRSLGQRVDRQQHVGKVCSGSIIGIGRRERSQRRAEGRLGEHSQLADAENQVERGDDLRAGHFVGLSEQPAELAERDRINGSGHLTGELARDEARGALLRVLQKDVAGKDVGVELVGAEAMA